LVNLKYYKYIFILGLTKLYEKANSMTAETIECPGWMHRFLIGKNGSNLRELIEDNEKVLIQIFYYYV